MPITIGSNLSALGAQLGLSKADNSLSKVFERLSSGQRINRASDDPAGLSIAASLSGDQRVFQSALRNINDGVSMLSIADGALRELSSIVTRQKELAEQAANGVYSLKQRIALDKEANSLVDEFNRIVATTTFNNIQLLDPQNGPVNIQAGYGAAGTLSVDAAALFARNVGTGTFAAGITLARGTAAQDAALGDFNGDGKIDMYMSSGQVTLGNGDGTFSGPQTYSSFGLSFLETIDLNGDGKLDVISDGSGAGEIVVVLGNGNGSFKAAATYLTGGTDSRRLAFGDYNGDGKLDVATAGVLDQTYSVLLGNGDGSFKRGTSFAGVSGAGLGISAITTGDLNGDGILDLASSGDDNLIQIALGNGNGTFRAPVSYQSGGASNSADDIRLADFNRDGILDAVTASWRSPNGTINVFLGNANGTFKSATTYASVTYAETLVVTDINGDGLPDISVANAYAATGQVQVWLSNGDGTFKTSGSFDTLGAGGSSSPFGLKGADLNGDGVTDLLALNRSDNFATILLANTTKVATQGYMQLTTQADAKAAMTELDTTLKRINMGVSSIGAYQSRLGFENSMMQTLGINYGEAASRILDADVAEESANLVRLQILRNGAASILAQANQEPKIALTLLQNAK